MEGRFTRWQSITIAQLGYAINLVLSFSVASLGFALSLAKETAQLASNCWAKHLLLFSIVLILFSIGAGLLCVINRLEDFKKTESIARDKERGELPPCEYARRRAETVELGKRTWRLCFWQIRLFCSGLLALVAGFLTLYYRNLV
jgi:hypothetical protein